MVTNKDGRVSWDFGAKPPGSQTAGQARNGPRSKRGCPSIARCWRAEPPKRAAGADRPRERIAPGDLRTEPVAARMCPWSGRCASHFSLDQSEARLGRGPLRAGGGESRPWRRPFGGQGGCLRSAETAAQGLGREPAGGPPGQCHRWRWRSSRRANCLAEIGQSLPATADAKVLERLAFKAGVKADAKAVTVSDGRAERWTTPS